MGSLQTKEEEKPLGEQPHEYGANNESNNDNSKAKVKKMSSHLSETIVDDLQKTVKEKRAVSFNEAIPDDDPAAAVNVGGGTNSTMIESKQKNNKRLSRNKQQFQDLLLEEEMELRNFVNRRPGAQGKGGICNVILTAIVNLLSAFLIFVIYLISLESLLSIALSISMTIYTYNQIKNNINFDGSIMNWVLLSFAVITPLSASITMAFSRRERALGQIADFKATMINLFSSHACWDWAKISKEPSGRAASTTTDWLEHTDEVLHTLCQISSELTRLLTLPSANRARHRVISYGKKQRADLVVLSRKLRRSILDEMNFLTSKCEVLKKEGLPPNEATRVRQWERFLSVSLEQLLMVKRYRTPQALRSFARIFTVFLPPFFAPYYGQMAIDMNSLGLAVVFSIITSIVLTSLFESVVQLEDPFVGSRLDCIDVEAELRDEFLVELIDIRNYHFPDAPEFKMDIEIPVIERGPEIRLFRA